MKKYLLVILMVIFSVFAVSCTDTEDPIDTRITLLDLVGKTEVEIQALYENSDINIIFLYVETNDVNPGVFIQYRGGYVAGNQVASGFEIRIDIAVALNTSFELLNLSGRSQAQINALYQGIDLTLVFETVQTNSVVAGRFVEYVGYVAGDSVQLGSTITILLATPVQIELVDLSGLTQQEIEELYENNQINLIFENVQTNTVPSGVFVAYVDYQVGDFVGINAEVKIRLAVPAPTAPVITGADDTDVFVSVTGNPPTFDLREGVQAFDYQGNEIAFGGFFFILKIEDSLGNTLPDVDYYRLGVYTVFYRAINSQLITTVERQISIIIPPFDTNHTDNLRLTEDYVGKSFINDGIGEVVVTTFTDGDTTNFMDLKTGIRFTVRYLGVDTPEATSKFDPWGIKAGNFVREKLTNAEKIILQSEGPVTTDGNGRYLAWIWYVQNGQTRLLNLELVEQAYGWVSGATSTQYGNIFAVAGAETQLTGRRIYGEVDPDFDYSSDGTPVNIGYLLDNFDEYLSRKVIITGIITSKVGVSVYIEQDGRGIFLYTGFSPTNELQIGHEVTIQGLVAAVYFNSKQLSNYKYENMKLESTDNEVPITTIMGNQIANYEGRVVNFENLTIQSIFQSSANIGYNVYAVDDLGNVVNIRVDAYTASFVPVSLFIIGKQISVFGPVSQFNTSYQVVLPGLGNIVFKD